MTSPDVSSVKHVLFFVCLATADLPDFVKMYLGLDRAHFLSPSGSCKAFDASADGYCRAEGCGVFVIKKLSDAIADGDRIHATIKAVEINQSGNTHSITHPHVPTQEALFESIFNKTNIDPHEVSKVDDYKVAGRNHCLTLRVGIDLGC